MSSGLAYLPEHFPDESFYSYFARYRADLGLSQDSAVHEIFGGPVRIATSGLQVSLRKALRQLQCQQFPTVEALITKTTTYGYYGSFTDKERATNLRQSLLDDVRGATFVGLGLGTSGVRPNDRMRFCPDCVEGMEARYYNIYWRRAHQLPNVLVCPDHGATLMDSEVIMAGSGNANSICAEAAVEGLATPVIDGSLSRDAHALLLDLARRSADLLSSPHLPVSYQARARMYRERIKNAGLTKGDLIPQHEFRIRYGAFVTPVAGILGGIAPDSPGARTATPLWQVSDRLHHPVRHILFGMFLDQAKRGARIAETRPHEFGPGPWPCANVLCDFVDQAVVTSFWLSARPSGTGKQIGNFACDRCGFVYTLEGDVTGQKRVINRGARFIERVRDLAPHLSASQIGKRLGAGVMIVRGHAARAKIELKPPLQRHKRRRACLTIEDYRERFLSVLRENPRVTRTQLSTCHARCVSRLQRDDRDWLREHLPAPVPLQRIEWPAVDVRLCVEIERVAEEMRHAVPLIRVSARQILMKVATLSWRKRHDELPQSLALLRSLDEAVDQYQDRRLTWAIKEMVAAGQPLRVRAVAQKARLDAKVYYKIHEALRAHMSP